MEQEPADELIGAECHDAPPVGAIAATTLVAHGRAGVVEREQTLVDMAIRSV